jgi:hypothetical protein
MSDDLVKQLRTASGDACRCGTPVCLEAADRIEKLEAALAKVADGYETKWSTSSVTNMLDIAQILSERIVIARKALEGKDD